MSAVLEVESVSKTFTRTKALAGVSMTIEPGEVHALLGQNGSGKSTLIEDPLLIPRARPGRWYPGGRAMSRRSSYPAGAQPARMPVCAAGPRARLHAVSPGQHGARVRLSHVVRNDQLEGNYKQAKNDLERLSLDINPKALVATLSASERTGVAIALLPARGSAVPGLSARARRADGDASG